MIIESIPVSVIAYLFNLLIVGSTKEECLSNLEKTSMLNQLLLLRNLTDIINYPFITRIMTDIHKSSPLSGKYIEICDANQLCPTPSTISYNLVLLRPCIGAFLTKYFPLLINTNPNSTTLEIGDYSTFQSHVMSIIRIQKSSTAELLMKSWEPSTLKVYGSSYSRFRNFCTSNSLNPANITLVVFMDYLTHLFKHKPPLAFSTINGHRSMLNQLLLLKNQTDIVNDPFITRIMTGIHKLRPSSAKYQEIWDANQVFKYLFTIKVIPKYTYTALLKKTLVLCKIFGLARSSDLVKWSFNGLVITPDSIKGPVVNAKEQRKGVLSILELTSLDDINSQVCPVRHLSTYLRASKGRRKPHSGDSVFKMRINIIVLSTLSSSGIDISKFKSHSTRSAMASLLLSNNVPFHVVKKMGRWKSNDTVDTFYDKRIIGEKSGGY
ncbi:hypothetical protein ACTFIR_003944 [Dictyostelium discoideum]